MVLEVIYVTRHGFRSNWLVDPSTGDYSASLKSPTGIAADPALTAHGVDQAKELAAHLLTVDPPVEKVYSSPYYRCLQTVEPFVRRWSQLKSAAAGDHQQQRPRVIHGETGIAEWFGAAPFEHPVPAPTEKLKELFPAFDASYVPAVVPRRTGESIAQLHDRVASALDSIIEQCDREGVRAALLCSHAATIIALGRALTGSMPDNVEAEDFRAFTCGLSVYRRRGNTTAVPCTVSSSSSSSVRDAISSGRAAGDSSPNKVGAAVDWRDGRGVRGGWDCEVNGDCSFLTGGEERGWRFSGDESFDVDPRAAGGRDAGVELGVIVEGRRPGKDASGDSRL